MSRNQRGLLHDLSAEGRAQKCTWEAQRRADPQSLSLSRLSLSLLSLSLSLSLSTLSPGCTPRAPRTELKVHLPGSMWRESGIRAIGQQGCRLAGDGEFLISGNDGDLGGGAGRGDDPGGPGLRIVQHRVDDDAEPVQAVGDGGP
jgi:hypothetical protein